MALRPLEQASTMLDQELEVSFRARRCAYVVDPLLALGSPYGAQLISRLSAHAELTVTRTFWQIIDSSDFYRRDPLAFWPSAMRETLPEGTAEDFRQALSLWENVRLRSDLARCRVYWINDNLSGSMLPDGAPPDLIERYEGLHQALTARSDPNDDATESAAFYAAIDSLALAAALGNASVLTLAPELPRSCLARVCAHVGLSLEAPPESGGDLVSLEQRRIRELIVAAGCSSLLWGGLRIAVVHPLLYGDLMLREDATALEDVDHLAIDRIGHDHVAMDHLGMDHLGMDHLGMDRHFDYIEPPAAMPPGDPWRASRHFWHAV